LAINRQYGRTPANRPVPGSIDSEILALSKMSISDLRKVWRVRFEREAPPVRSRTILCGLIAWQLQSEATGGLDRATERALIKIGQALSRDGSYEPKIRSGFSPGVVLSREWKGVIHRVTAAEGGFDYLGKKYRSLSDVARTITGTRWSGPRFFGLEQKSAVNSQVVAL